MELYLIGEEKLKVLLTPFDMMKYDLTIEKMDYENTETRKAIWSILDQAKHETGFDAARGRICIEVFPEKNGGCAIYITKIPKGECAEKGIELSEKKIAREIPSVFGFSEAEELLRVCAFLSKRGYALPSRAFFEPRGKGGEKYFLEIFEHPAEGRKTKKPAEQGFIEEFGTRMESAFPRSFLSEHCLPICEKNAVETLSSLANSAKKS